MKFLVRVFISWLPLAVALTGVCLLVYATVQQNYRESLNDPQIQMAEDGATFIEQGGLPADLVGNVSKIDVAYSLAPWIQVYDSSGTTAWTSALLDGSAPQVPKGVLEAALKGEGKDTQQPGEDRVTWETSSGVRQAIVVVAVPDPSGMGFNGFVVAGRNMREVEDREGALSSFVGLAWIVLLAATFVVKAFALYCA